VIISGVVRDGAGHPVEQARVYFTDGPAPFPDVAALTAADGRYVLSVPTAGRYVLESNSEGFLAASATVDVPPGQDVTADLDLGRTT
jgi:hypothetical protein